MYTNNHGFPVAEQTLHNSTGWIGHYPGDAEIIMRGQTFMASKEGDLEAIEVYSNSVADPGKVIMTVHNVDPEAKSWGPALDTTSVEFKKTDSGKWVAFPLHGLHLVPGKCYGFKMEANDSLIGIGESAGSAKNPPFRNGQEWKFTSETDFNSFDYFSLAFRVEARA